MRRYLTELRLDFDQARWSAHWRLNRGTREYAAQLLLTPRPPDVLDRRGERAPELLRRVADHAHNLSEVSGRMTADVFDAFAKRCGFADVDFLREGLDPRPRR